MKMVKNTVLVPGGQYWSNKNLDWFVPCKNKFWTLKMNMDYHPALTKPLYFQHLDPFTVFT